MEWLLWLNHVNAAAVAAVLLYWEFMELRTSRADKRSGSHRFLIRVGIRLLLPAAGLLLIMQLIGFEVLPINLAPNLIIPTYVAGQLIFWGGAVLAIWSRVAIGQHWAHAAEYQIIPGQSLVTHGPYSRIRHPIYTALLLLFLGGQLIVQSWLTLLMIPLLAFIYWQAWKEEQLLLTQFGDTYRDYRRRTGRIFPRL